MGCLAEFKSRRMGQMTLVAIMATALFACSHMSEDYKPNPPDSNVKPNGLRVAVVELEDRNGEDEEPSKALGLLIQLPLIPYVSHPPDHSASKIASCLADELRESGVFSHVDYFESWGSEPRQFLEYDVLVTGTLIHNRYTLTTTTYGLGLAGMYLWFLGPPMGFYDRETMFDIAMLDPKSPYSSIPIKTVQFKQRKWHNFYNRLSSDHAYHESKAAYFRLSFDDCPSAELTPSFKNIPMEIDQASRHTKEGAQGLRGILANTGEQQ